jgi:alpha-tubulin suppressor-like RCC1 family protein
MAIRADGSAVAWGINWSGMCEVPALPPGVTYVAIDSGEDFAAALRSDGSVVAWGANHTGQCNVPALPPGLTYTQISCRGTNGTPIDY